MSKERTNKLKEIFLLVFTSISIILILTIWSSNIMERQNQTPGFYRPTLSVDESDYLTVTAVSTKGGEQEHKGGGEHSSSTPTIAPNPDFNPTPSPTDGPDQVN